MTVFLRRMVLITAAAIVLGFGWKALAGDIPSSPGNYIYDGAAMIEASDYQTITRLLTEADRKTSAQVAVVTVPTTEPETIETYAVKLFEKWGIGQKGKDNGVLFLIAKNDRKMRIEVGYGLEGALTDAICNRIINDIVVPQFKQSNFSVGIVQGTSAIVSLIAKEYNVAITGEENAVYERVTSADGDSGGSWLFVLLLFAVVVIIILSYTPRAGYGGGYWYGGGGSYGSGGGFSGGGFGGFGGGMSGGGGSSGGW
jgi:uncharacterized protein